MAFASSHLRLATSYLDLANLFFIKIYQSLLNGSAIQMLYMN